MKSKIPDRWADYQPYGCVIEGTKFLACKVPLKEALMRRLPSNYEFTPATLMSEVPNIKCIVDLTGTSRYYDVDEFTSNGIQHRKIEVPGQRVPRPFHIRKFFAAVDELLASLENDEIIAIHCTHGLNRTGYLICRYLVERLGWSLPVAITKFQKARGHEIERIEYIKDLERMVARASYSANLGISAENTRIIAPLQYQKPVCHYYNPYASHHIDSSRRHQSLRFPVTGSIPDNPVQMAVPYSHEPVNFTSDNNPNERHIRFDSPPQRLVRRPKKAQNLEANGSMLECKPEMAVPMPGCSIDFYQNQYRHVRLNSPQQKFSRDKNNHCKKTKSRTIVITNWRDHTPPSEILPPISKDSEVKYTVKIQNLEIKQDQEKSMAKKRKRRKRRSNR